MKSKLLINSLFALLLLLFVSCSARKITMKEVGDLKSLHVFRGFVPIDPMELNSKVPTFDANGVGPSKRDVRSLRKEEILKFLSNETVLTTISQVDIGGEMVLGPSAFSTKNSKYRVTMDYMKYSTLMVGDTARALDGFARVGVGLRVILSIFANKSKIALTDLFSIGFAAEANQLSGSLMIEIIGIKSDEVTSAIPLPSEINPTTIQLVMSSMATIKSKIYDSKTELIPQIIAVQSEDATFRDEMLRHFTDYQYKGYPHDSTATVYIKN